MSGSVRVGRRAIALALAAALAVPGGLMVTPVALAAGAHKTSSASATSSSAAAVTPTVPSNAGGLSGFPTPSVATTTAANPTAVQTAATNTAGSSTFSSSSALVIVAGAVIILVAISYFIWRDARQRAPVRADAGLPSGEGRSKPGSKAPPKPRKLSAAERKRRKRGRAKR